MILSVVPGIAQTAVVPGGVFGAACRLIQGYSEDWIRTPFYDNEVVSQLISAALFVGLCVYLWFGSMRHKEDRA